MNENSIETFKCIHYSEMSGHMGLAATLQLGFFIGQQRSDIFPYEFVRINDFVRILRECFAEHNEPIGEADVIDKNISSEIVEHCLFIEDFAQKNPDVKYVKISR